MNHNHDRVLRTDTIEVTLPRNTKYVSKNPISRLLIQNFMRSLLALLHQLGTRPQRVLDVGTGEGLVPRQLAVMWPDVTLDGLDLDIELLHVARELAPPANWLVGSIYDLPARSAAYELVLCTEVFEHLRQPHQALVEIARVTSRYCLMSVPNEPWWRAANMARGSYWSAWGNTPDHVNHWGTGEFVRFIQPYFEVVAVKRPFPWTMVLAQKRGDIH